MLAGALALLILGGLSDGQKAEERDSLLGELERNPNSLVLKQELKRCPEKAYSINRKIAETRRKKMYKK